MKVKSSFLTSDGTKSSVKFDNKNLAEFQTLFKKLCALLTFSVPNGISSPGAPEQDKAYLNESVPYSSITLFGSIPFPKLLLILRPKESRTKP